MSEIEIIIPEQNMDRISLDLIDLTRQLCESGRTKEEVHGILGGRYGYGELFENDTFMLHPYCWCEKDDCPWCAGCQAEIPHDPHVGCYQNRLDLLKRKFGEKQEGEEYWHVSYDHKEYAASRRAICKELGLDPSFGCEVHCTCGSDKRWEERYAACDCDWHKGRKQFRFGAAVRAPNFLHKPSGSKVWWYKYIGRDMKTGVHGDWKKISQECFDSLRKEG